MIQKLILVYPFSVINRLFYQKMIDFCMKYILALLLIVSSLLSNEKISLQLLWKHQFEFAGYYMAKEKGFYKDVGLEIEIKEFKFGINIISDVLNGTSDIGISHSDVILEKLRGKKLLILNAMLQSSPYVLISQKRNDLRTIKDFKNKKIMISNDLEANAAISSMLKINDISKTDYITVKHTFNPEDITNNHADLQTAYISNEPYELKQKGIEIEIFNPRNYGFNFYDDISFTSLKCKYDHPESLKKFQEASLLGWKYAFNHIDETVDVILKQYNTQKKSKEALLYEANILKSLAMPNKVPLGNTEMSRIEEIANVYRLIGATNNSNEELEDIIFKPYNFLENLKTFLTLKVIFIILLSVIIIIYLIIYRQNILKKQNLVLEDLINDKTQELQEANQNLEDKVAQKTKKLELALNAKSDFLANMSHEIRTPLNAIIGFVDLLHKNEVDIDKLEKLEIIKESSHSLLYIINDILDYSKLENHKLELEHIDLEVKHTFEIVTKLFKQKAQEKNIEIVLNVDSKIPTHILGDAARIKQILSNLLSNAIKFSKKDSQVIIDVSCKEACKTLYCEVVDNGIGIDEKNYENIFHSFEQADSSVCRTYGGTGLGLAISRNLIECMGGEIGLISKIGEGSKFFFTIAIEKSLKMPEPLEQNTHTDAALQGKVLIVEDNKTNQLLLSMLIEELNLKFDIANDGLEAIEALKKQHYDIILMDENMPNMSGTQATIIIRNSDNLKDIPIIAITANALQGDKERFLKYGMTDYLAKPIDADELAIMLQKYL